MFLPVPAMDSFSLQSSHTNGLCRSNPNSGSNPLEIRANKQLGFDYYWKQRNIRWSNLSLIKCRTFVEGIEGGVSSSTDGSKPVVLHHEGNEELKGHLVGPVKPSSTSIVRFHLLSQPANTDDSNSKATGTLDLDEQVREQEVPEEDDVEEDEWGIRKSIVSNSNYNGTQDLDTLDKDQDVQEEDDVEEHNWRVREAIDCEGEVESSVGVPSSVIPEQKVGNESVVEDDFQEETVFRGEEKLLTKLKLSIVFVASEAAPYSKTGGLGDVCGSLPIALAARGHRVMVVSPRYMHGTAADKVYAGAFDANCRIKVNCFGGSQEVAFFHEYKNGVDWVFVDHYSYHRPGNPYGDSYGAFGDNQFRFTLLCHAACEAPLVLPLGGYTYGDNCLFLVNDWHAGLVPVLLAAKYRPYGVYKAARSILVIHNLSHQGVEPGVTYDNLGLPSHWYGALEWVFPEWARAHELDKGEAVNILKGAIVTADRILTVSQGYSWEITTVEGGYGLHELLTNRKFVLNGIINGINVDEWNPSNDPLIAAPYSVDDLSGKAECKAALQKELGLPIKPDCPLIGFIGRLDYQKGIDIIQEAFPQLMGDDVQFVMLGSGDARYERWMRAAEGACKDRFRGWVGFNIPISHKITAGCDILLMPSRFEPCGLNQLYAMRYGTVPVVHATGGLRDTVETYNPFAAGTDGTCTGTGTGWAFSPLAKESMLAALRNAIRTYRDYKESWVGLMKRGMLQDFTWDTAASQYEQVFQWAFIDPPYC